MGIEPTTFNGIYINSLSCSGVNRHLTGTVTFESDFLKPNEHMVPQSREIPRRFYDRGTNLTPNQRVKCLLALDVSNLNLVSFLTLRRFFQQR